MGLAELPAPASIDEILRGRVGLEVECLDRLNLDGYIPGLATAGGLVTFMREYLRKPIPSPRVLGVRRQSGMQALEST